MSSTNPARGPRPGGVVSRRRMLAMGLGAFLMGLVATSLSVRDQEWIDPLLPWFSYLPSGLQAGFPFRYATLDEAHPSWTDPGRFLAFSRVAFALDVVLWAIALGALWFVATAVARGAARGSVKARTGLLYALVAPPLAWLIAMPLSRLAPGPLQEPVDALLSLPFTLAGPLYLFVLAVALAVAWSGRGMRGIVPRRPHWALLAAVGVSVAFLLVEATGHPEASFQWLGGLGQPFHVARIATVGSGTLQYELVFETLPTEGRMYEVRCRLMDRSQNVIAESSRLAYLQGDAGRIYSQVPGSRRLVPDARVTDTMPFAATAPPFYLWVLVSPTAISNEATLGRAYFVPIGRYAAAANP